MPVPASSPVSGAAAPGGMTDGHLSPSATYSQHTGWEPSGFTVYTVAAIEINFTL